jgi:hypothetical protein
MGLENEPKPFLHLRMEVMVEDRERVRRLIEEHGMNAVLEWLVPPESLYEYIGYVLRHHIYGGEHVLQVPGAKTD